MKLSVLLLVVHLAWISFSELLSETPPNDYLIDGIEFMNDRLEEDRGGGGGHGGGGGGGGSGGSASGGSASGGSASGGSTSGGSASGGSSRSSTTSVPTCAPISSNLTYTKCGVVKPSKKSVVGAIIGSVLGLILCCVCPCALFVCYRWNRNLKGVQPEPAPPTSKLAQCKELDHIGFKLKHVTCQEMVNRGRSEYESNWTCNSCNCSFSCDVTISRCETCSLDYCGRCACSGPSIPHATVSVEMGTMATTGTVMPVAQPYGYGPVATSSPVAMYVSGPGSMPSYGQNHVVPIESACPHSSVHETQAYGQVPQAAPAMVPTGMPEGMMVNSSIPGFQPYGQVPQAAPVMTTIGGGRMIQVQVPANAVPGSTLQVATPEGTVVHVTIPPNHFPGQIFSMSY